MGTAKPREDIDWKAEARYWRGVAREHERRDKATAMYLARVVREMLATREERSSDTEEAADVRHGQQDPGADRG